MLHGVASVLTAGLLLFATSPSSTNYVLPSYDIGSGGTDNSSSTNFRLNGTAGTQNTSQQSSTNYRINSGENPTQNANVVSAPTLTNPENYYDRLRLVINTSNNPSDTRYLIAISSDGFATSRYVQTDNSIGTSTALTNYRTYSSFGGASGFLVLGLSPSTSYQARIKAIRGNFTENNFGPASSSVGTVSQNLSFGITTTLTSSPPFSASFTSISAGSVATANADINVALSTNAASGGSVYLKGANAGLFSSSQSYTISTVSADLGSAPSGYGARVLSTSQASGGPLTSLAPYNGAGNNVGNIPSSFQSLLSTPGPITTGASAFRLLAKTTSEAPSSNDYADTITVVAAMDY